MGDRLVFFGRFNLLVQNFVDQFQLAFVDGVIYPRLLLHKPEHRILFDFVGDEYGVLVFFLVEEV